MTSAQPVSHPTHRGAPPVSNPQQAVSPPSKEQLKSWWNKFGVKKKGKPEDQVPINPGIFGVPLSDSILYANVAISLTNEQGDSFIYGYVPIVVAKCGVFLKEKATDVEGIFRLSGSAKRIKDLQTIFNSPERYGKGLDWTGYTVHDAANILRRYLNQLPEPIVPLQYYEQFRDPLRAYQAKVGSTTQAQAMENQEHTHAVVAYQKLITQLPALNRQLLLYILDLLAVFASKSDLNRMTAQNLAAIFQPGIISHPSHDMAPNEYRLSQDVLIFLIENQDNFLIGMTGTAMDEKTKDEVKSGPPSIKTPKAAIGRSASTASAGADSIRRTGGPRRNGSMSSRHSRERGSPGVSSPATPASPSGLPGTTGSAGSGLGRSNTLPSNRSPPLAGPRFQRMSEANAATTPTANVLVSGGGPGSGLEEEEEEDPTPFPMMPSEDADFQKSPAQIGGGAGRPDSPTREHPAQDVTDDPSVPAQGVDVGMPIRQPANDSTPAAHVPPPLITQDTKPTQEPTSATPTSAKPHSRDRKISNLLSISPIFGPSDQSRDPNQRQPRKLQKRRIPGSHNESAQSSQASLNTDEGTFSHTPAQNPNNTNQDRSNVVDNQGRSVSDAMATSGTEQPNMNPNTTSPTSQGGPGRNLMPHSPTLSLRSRGSATDPSDLDALEDPAVREEKKRQNFRLSTSRYDPPLAPPPSIGQLSGARTSNSSLGSNRPRKSFTGDSQLTQTSVGDTSSTGQPSFMHISSRESADLLKDGQNEPEKKGLFGRFKAKINQTREHYEAERAKSPPRIQGEHASSRTSLSAFTHDHFGGRGRSFDRPREDSLSNFPERDQPQRAETHPVPTQSIVQTFVQPPTPAPGSAPKPESAQLVSPTQTPALPPPAQLQQQPVHSMTFPIAGTSVAPSVASAPAPAPVAQPDPVPQETSPSKEADAGPASLTRGSHNEPQTVTVAPKKPSIHQETTDRPVASETEPTSVLSEQAIKSSPSSDPVQATDPVPKIEQHGETGQPDQPTQSVHVAPQI